MPVIKHATKPDVERIYRLVDRIDTGDIKIPKFQRGFIWTDDQILYILESIYNGYPIGSLLFWLTKTPMTAERDIGGFELPSTPDQYPRNYVLDGQQRLTSIYGVLMSLIHISEPTRLLSISYAVFCLKKKNIN